MKPHIGKTISFLFLCSLVFSIGCAQSEAVYITPTPYKITADEAIALVSDYLHERVDAMPNSTARYYAVQMFNDARPYTASEPRLQLAKRVTGQELPNAYWIVTSFNDAEWYVYEHSQLIIPANDIAHDTLFYFDTVSTWGD